MGSTDSGEGTEPLRRGTRARNAEPEAQTGKCMFTFILRRRVSRGPGAPGATGGTRLPGREAWDAVGLLRRLSSFWRRLTWKLPPHVWPVRARHCFAEEGGCDGTVGLANEHGLVRGKMLVSHHCRHSGRAGRATRAAWAPGGIPHPPGQAGATYLGIFGSHAVSYRRRSKNNSPGGRWHESVGRRREYEQPKLVLANFWADVSVRIRNRQTGGE